MINCSKYLTNIRDNHPLIHSITNYVTVNDCANVLLACGAAPVMADEPEDAAEIARSAAALNINIGTLNRHTIPAMLAAGKEANRLAHPVVLDPVGAGATKLRYETAKKLLAEVSFSVIKGNVPEIEALLGEPGTMTGVDASQSPCNLDTTVALARKAATQTGAVIVITGETDVVADNVRAVTIHNGHPMMAKVTGTGCMLSALIAAFISVSRDEVFEATVSAVCAMGLCGENAFECMNKSDGNAGYRNHLIDAVYNLDNNTFERGVRYEMR